jgi:hypothetical protein
MHQSSRLGARSAGSAQMSIRRAVDRRYFEGARIFLGDRFETDRSRLRGVVVGVGLFTLASSLYGWARLG